MDSSPFMFLVQLFVAYAYSEFLSFRETCKLLRNHKCGPRLLGPDLASSMADGHLNAPSRKKRKRLRVHHDQLGLRKVFICLRMCAVGSMYLPRRGADTSRVARGLLLSLGL